MFTYRLWVFYELVKVADTEYFEDLHVNHNFIFHLYLCDKYMSDDRFKVFGVSGFLLLRIFFSFAINENVNFLNLLLILNQILLSAPLHIFLNGLRSRFIFFFMFSFYFLTL